MKTLFLNPGSERFRDRIPTMVMFPDDVKIQDYEIYGYFGRHNHLKLNNTSIHEFDSISYMKSFQSGKDKHQTLHVIGYSYRDDKTIVLTLKRKKHEIQA